MTIHNQIQLFETKKIRTVWDDAAEKWYFSVVDVVGVLTDQPTTDRAKKYWSVLKVRLKKEGFEPTTNCSQLKLLAADGKMRLTDIIYNTWSGMTAKEYKHFKGLKKENLRDNMTNRELVIKWSWRQKQESQWFHH